ncbi:MAG: tRNA glutamyl-Q(34) synthetase GluQRS [Pseudomonadales bacterium]|jgi:glutamyl-Q tRNA(Asp) synthetase|nr:tRNA glutamyl-Q(34) synthetase GluQRS [Pseudomonadales bacterium]
MTAESASGAREQENGDAPCVGRFAPSPSGPLHLGSLLAAAASWLDARAARGQWLVRIEDLDPPREVAGADRAILDALEGHGLTWDGDVLYQSTRTEAYEAAIARLEGDGRMFRCTCTRRRIRELGGVYDGRCRDRGMAVTSRSHALRIRVPNGAISFTDRLRGHCSQDLAEWAGDFILKRRDGLFAYQLAVVVDDAAQGITDVVRGADLLDSTPRQIFLQRCLGLTTPRYLHLPLLVHADGEKLSKQTGAPGLAPGEAKRNLAQVLGWLGIEAEPTDAPERQLTQALDQWSPARLPRQPIVVPTGKNR